MKFTSQVYTQASGSVGGLTYSHNRSGMYTRARSTPTDPASTLQLERRSNFSYLVNAWATVLTSGQRVQWEQYAASMPRLNTLGQTIYLTGQQMFIRCMSYRLLVGSPILTTAPMPNASAEFTVPADPIIDASANTVSVAYFNSDPWAATIGGFLHCFLSRPRNASRMFSKGPYRYLGSVVGDTTTPPTSPEVFTTVGVWVVTASTGQKCNVKCVAQNADGSLASPWVTMPIIIA